MPIQRDLLGNPFFVPGDTAVAFSVTTDALGHPIYVSAGGAGADGAPGAKGDTGATGAKGDTGSAGSGGGGGVVMSYVSGKWYLFPGQMPSPAAAALLADTLNLAPFVPEVDMTITDLAILTTAGVAAANVKLGIYAANATTRKPTGNVLQSTGNVSVATSSVVTSGALGAALALTKGTLYYTAVLASADSVATQGVTGASDPGHSIIGGESTPPTDFMFSGQIRSGWRITGQTFASGFPDVTAATFTSGGNFIPLISFKAQ